MSKDILFQTDDVVFSYRVGGILIHEHQILLQKPPNDHYSIIGGHVSALETTERSLTREFQEELHADIEIDRLMAVGEIFFHWGSRPCHQLCLYYAVRLTEPAQIPLTGVFHGYDDLGGQRIDLDFCWLPLDQLQHQVIYPRELVPIILDRSPVPVHFVSNQL